jgi:pteridine reductase
MGTETARASGAVYLVTGAARRVGAEIARTLHATGAQVAIHCHRSVAEADSLAGALNELRPASAAVFRVDLCDLAALPDLIGQVVARFGALHGLVNNASSFRPTPLGGIDGALWEDLIGSNLKAPLFLAQAAAPHLRASSGAIVNIVDIHAVRPLKDHLVYSAAKAGLAGLTRALALELAPRVRVNGVAPGAILWPESGDAYPDAERARILATTPLARTGTALEIARAVKYLLLDAEFVTGQILAVDGGREVYM